jgi:hypothetical protein
MKTGAPSFRRRSIFLAAAGILALVLTACTGRGGGYLPPDSVAGFTGQASLGFTFSCQDSGGINPPTGKLAIELAYLDKGSNPIGSSFSIHGIVDVIDPVLESAVCIGNTPAPGGKLIFLGRYYLTSSAPAGFPSTCPTPKTKTATTLLCRFEVQVQDNDRNMAPSKGDFFSIQLSTHIAYCDGSPLGECSQLPAGSVFYTRAGFLAGGNITVK